MTLNDYLDRIVGWKEEKNVSIPIKKIPNKVKPTTEIQYYSEKLTRISITARVTTSHLNQLKDLEKSLEKQILTDSISNKSF